MAIMSRLFRSMLAGQFSSLMENRVPSSILKPPLVLRRVSDHKHPESIQLYAVISFYKFLDIDRPEDLKSKLALELAKLQSHGRIYLNKVGINVQMCLPLDQLSALKHLLIKEISSDLSLKVQYSESQVFQRLRVRNGKLLEHLTDNFRPKEVGKYVDPDTWNQMLDNKDEHTVVLDVRNVYEWDVGHFQHSIRPKADKFSELLSSTEEFETNYGSDKDRTVMMYCTGGIRCELYSAILKEKGFKHVYQLEGGILNYGARAENTSNWRGKLFVFDDRMVVPISEDRAAGGSENDTISKCRHCGTFSDTCYNCNSHLCNKVFLSCRACAVKYNGCCSGGCFSKTKHLFNARNKRQVVARKTIGRGEHFRNLFEPIKV